MLLIEGLDRVGKSIVTEMLRGMLTGWSARHHTKPPCGAYPYYMWFVADAHPRVVIDRLHWSGYAYGRTFRKQEELTAAEWRTLELCLLAHRTTVIRMTDDLDAVKGRWTDDEMFPADKLTELSARFDELAKGGISHLPYQTFTLPELVRDGKPTARLHSIAAEAADNGDFCANLPPPSVANGWTWGGGFMVIAEAPSDFKGPSLVPQTPMDRGPGAETFWEALDRAKIDWSKGYYAHASAYHGSVHMAGHIASTIRPRALVALGDKAQDMVARARKRGDLDSSIMIYEDHHPTYMKQFQWGGIPAWQERLGAFLQEWQQ